MFFVVFGMIGSVFCFDLGFVECTGPPDFLNNCVAAPEETREALGVLDRRARDRSKRDKKDLPAGTPLKGFNLFDVRFVNLCEP